MAPTAVADRHAEELTDERIEQLLQQAEERIRNSSSSALAYPPATKSSSLKRKLDEPGLPTPYIQTNGDIARADPRRLVEDSTRQQANGIRKVEDPLVVKKRKLEAKKATAGADWYNLPKTNLTPELKRDLDLLRMRSVLDPKRFYKKESTKAKPPEFSQVGTVVEGPTDFFSSRIPKRDRKRTLAEEVLAGEKEDGRFKRQYAEVQAKRTSGKKGDFKKRMKERYGKKYKG